MSNANVKFHEFLLCLLPSDGECITLADITLIYIHCYYKFAELHFFSAIPSVFCGNISLSVGISKSLMRWSLSHSTTGPHVADGGTTSRYRG